MAWGMQAGDDKRATVVLLIIPDRVWCPVQLDGAAARGYRGVARMRSSSRSNPRYRRSLGAFICQAKGQLMYVEVIDGSKCHDCASVQMLWETYECAGVAPTVLIPPVFDDCSQRCGLAVWRQRNKDLASRYGVEQNILSGSVFLSRKSSQPAPPAAILDRRCSSNVSLYYLLEIVFESVDIVLYTSSRLWDPSSVGLR